MMPLPDFFPAYDVALVIRTGSHAEAERAREAVTGAASAACSAQGRSLGALVAFIERVAVA